MNELDTLILIVIALSIGVGVFRGAIREVIHIAGWVLAFILAGSFSRQLAPYFADWMSEPVFRVALAWVVILLAVLMLASLLASLLSGLAHRIGLGPLDRVVGGVIGLARAGIIILLLTLIAGLTKFPQSAWWKEAAFTPWLENVALHVRSFLPDAIAARIVFRAPLTPVRQGA